MHLGHGFGLLALLIARLYGLGHLACLAGCLANGT